eukprot:4419087-Pleurochrysis_carterae.AAC.1
MHCAQRMCPFCGNTMCARACFRSRVSEPPREGADGKHEAAARLGGVWAPHSLSLCAAAVARIRTTGLGRAPLELAHVFAVYAASRQFAFGSHAEHPLRLQSVSSHLLLGKHA